MKLRNTFSKKARRRRDDLFNEFYRSSSIPGLGDPLNREKVLDLIAKGADLTPYKKQASLLHLAIMHSDFEIVESLLNHGADIHARDNVGSTPLMYAAQFGDSRILQLLLDKGARVNDKSASLGDKDVAQNMYRIMLGQRGGNTALMDAAGFGHLECVRKLLTAGAHIDEKNDNGNSALIYACAGGDESVILYLLDQGSAIDEPGETWGNMNLLMYGVHSGSIEVVRRFLTHGLDISAVNKDGENALDIARRDAYEINDDDEEIPGNQAIVELLEKILHKKNIDTIVKSQTTLHNDLKPLKKVRIKKNKGQKP